MRLSQRERRERKSERVLDAALELMLERGYANLRTADIAERAGVSRGAQTHYFPTKQELAVAAAARAMASAIDEARAAAEAVHGGAAQAVLDAFVAHAERFYFESSYPAMIDILMASRIDPTIAGDFRSLIKRTRGDLEQIWSKALTEAGFAPSQVRVALVTTHSMLRGLAISGWWEDPDWDRAPAIRDWRETLGRLIAQAP